MWQTRIRQSSLPELQACACQDWNGASCSTVEINANPVQARAWIKRQRVIRSCSHAPLYCKLQFLFAASDLQEFKRPIRDYSSTPLLSKQNEMNEYISMWLWLDPVEREQKATKSHVQSQNQELSQLIRKVQVWALRRVQQVLSS
jgi:hypothetical protein